MEVFIVLLLNFGLVFAGKVYPVVEEQPDGTFVADVREQLPRNLSSKADLKFGFLRGYDKKGFFRINESSGVITTATKLDRETLCPAREENNCYFDIPVITLPLHQFQIIPIKVELLDINDNAPAFAQREMLLEISESQPVGAKFQIVSAVDVDQGKSAQIEYSLKSGKDIPFVIINSVNGETQDVHLQLTAPLDREGKDFYAFSVLAQDQGSPALVGSIDVVIQVTDANDHNPVFDESSYEVRVQENVPRGMRILKVHATDADLGRNSEITYTISPSTSKLVRDIFDIDSETGELSLKSELDREVKDIHKVWITAKDRAANPRESSILATVIVDDLNDNPPLIDISYFPPEANSAFIAEDAPVGTFVALVRLKDADAGNNARAICTLNSDTFELKEQSESTYAIVTSRLLDREKREEYLLELTAKDHGKPALESRTTLQIVVGDVNDSPPIFDRSTYVVKVKENSPLGMEIVQLRVTDKDSAPESQIVQYQLLEPSALFNLDKKRGVLFIQSQLDRETLGDVITLNVEVLDPSQQTQFRSQVPVVIEIMDENDNAPQFSSSVFEFEITNDLKAGVVVGSVLATDVDFGNNGLVTYQLNSSDFIVNQTSGDIITAHDIYVNDARQIQLTLIAKDSGEPKRSSSAQVFITIANSTTNQLVSHDYSPLSFFLSSTGLPIIIALIGVSLLLLGVAVASVICYRNKSKDQNVYNVRMETARVFQKGSKSQLTSGGENGGLGVQESDTDSCHRQSVESDEKYASWVFSSQTPPVSSSTKSSRCSSANTNRNSLLNDYGKVINGPIIYDVVNEESGVPSTPGKSVQTFQLANQLQKTLDDGGNGAVSEEDDDGGFLKAQHSVIRASSFYQSARHPLTFSTTHQAVRSSSSANGSTSPRYVTLPRRVSLRSSSSNSNCKNEPLQRCNPFFTAAQQSPSVMVATPLNQTTRDYINSLQVPFSQCPSGSVDSGADTTTIATPDSLFSSSLNMSCKSFGIGLEYDDFLPNNASSPIKPICETICQVTEYQSFC